MKDFLRISYPVMIFAVVMLMLAVVLPAQPHLSENTDIYRTEDRQRDKQFQQEVRAWMVSQTAKTELAVKYSESAMKNAYYRGAHK